MEAGTKPTGAATGDQQQDHGDNDNDFHDGAMLGHQRLTSSKRIRPFVIPIGAAKVVISGEAYGSEVPVSARR